MSEWHACSPLLRPSYGIAIFTFLQKWQICVRKCAIWRINSTLFHCFDGGGRYPWEYRLPKGAFKHKTKVARVWVDHLTCGIGISRVTEKGERKQGHRKKKDTEERRCGIKKYKGAPLYRHWGSAQAVRPVGGVELYLYTFLTKALEGSEGSASRPGRSLPLGKTRSPFYRRLGGRQGRSGQVLPVAIRYTDYATRPRVGYR